MDENTLMDSGLIALFLFFLLLTVSALAESQRGSSWLKDEYLLARDPDFEAFVEKRHHIEKKYLGPRGVAAIIGIPLGMLGLFVVWSSPPVGVALLAVLGLSTWFLLDQGKKMRNDLRALRRQVRQDLKGEEKFGDERKAG